MHERKEKVRKTHEPSDAADYAERIPQARAEGERESKLVWNWGFRDYTTELKEREREKIEREELICGHAYGVFSVSSLLQIFFFW